MTSNTANQILAYIKQNTQASPKDLYNLLEISPRAIFKQLKTLSDKGLVKKSGQPPKVYYTLAAAVLPSSAISHLNKTTQEIIEKNFYYITPLGQEKIGVTGFNYWCEKQHLKFHL